MKKETLVSVIRIVGVLIVAIILSMMLLGLAGCRTVDIAKSNTAIDSTATQTKTVDSSSYKLIEALIKYGKSTEKTYTPGRDTVIVNAESGEIRIIQLPGQLITERIIEHGEQQTRQEESKIYSATDSLMIEFIKSQKIKDKEIKTIPLPLIIGGFIFLLILIASLFLYLKSKK